MFLGDVHEKCDGFIGVISLGLCWRCMLSVAVEFFFLSVIWSENCYSPCFGCVFSMGLPVRVLPCSFLPLQRCTDRF